MKEDQWRTIGQDLKITKKNLNSINNLGAPDALPCANNAQNFLERQLLDNDQNHIIALKITEKLKLHYGDTRGPLPFHEHRDLIIKWQTEHKTDLGPDDMFKGQLTPDVFKQLSQ